MRLWTLHPQYLDSKGLVALWREALLAQAVVSGRTTGYQNHPQLVRFRACSDPLAAIASYLEGVFQEAVRRGYDFDASKIGPLRAGARIQTTRGQLLFEWEHLRRKLAKRAPGFDPGDLEEGLPRAHPLFEIVDGPEEEWERAKGG